MGMLWRFADQATPKRQQTSDIRLPWRRHAAIRLDDIVKAQFEFRVFTEATECLGHRMVRIQYGEHMARACVAMSRQFVETADRDVERGYRFHCPSSVAPTVAGCLRLDVGHDRIGPALIELTSARRITA